MLNLLWIVFDVFLMWLRSKTKQMGDHEAFVTGLIAALSSEPVVNKLQQCLTEPLRYDINKLQDDLQEMKNELNQSTESNKQLQNEVSALRQLVKNKDQQICQLEDRIKAIEITIDEQEQYSRGCSLRVTGLPEMSDERLMDRFLVMANTKMNLTIDEDDIEKIHRIGVVKPGRIRSIIVKMKNYNMKTKVLKAKGNLRKTRTTVYQHDAESHTPPEGVNLEMVTEDFSKVFINEDLTKARSHLLWLARLKKKNKQINDCWSFNGKIMIKNKQNQIKQIKCETDLES